MVKKRISPARPERRQNFTMRLDDDDVLLRQLDELRSAQLAVMGRIPSRSEMVRLLAEFAWNRLKATGR